VVLSTEKMRRILEIDLDDMVCVTEPGVITGELQDAVEAQGLFYPPDPASLAFCSIGGNVAENAGGPRAFKYGVTREYVVGLDVTLMGGESLRVGRRTAKGVTGYDLVAGFVGSEGTFGVTTEIVLKLLPNPQAVSMVLAVFPDTAAAGAAIRTLLKRGLVPRTMELADRTSIDHVRRKSRYVFPQEAGAFLLIEIDGEPEGLEPLLGRIGEVCEAEHAIDMLAAEDPADRRALWEARRLISSSVKEAHRYKISEDICVPRGAIGEMLGRTRAISEAFDLPIAVYGHAGDGNLHVNIVTDDDPLHPEVARRLDGAVLRLFEETIALRGTLSGEHGIGLVKRDYMPLEQSAAVLEWQRRWKRMWDPRELLNPGKVLPARTKPCSE
jgi:glycolate oxidase